MKGKKQMEEKILSIICDILKLEKEQLMSEFDQKGVWDSLTLVELIFSLEEELDIQFDEETLANIATPKLLYEAALREATK